MIDITKIKAVGFKDMHPLQVQAITDLIDLTMHLASHTGHPAALDDAQQTSEDMVRLFGGVFVVNEDATHPDSSEQFPH